MTRPALLLATLLALTACSDDGGGSTPQDEGDGGSPPDAGETASSSRFAQAIPSPELFRIDLARPAGKLPAELSTVFLDVVDYVDALNGDLELTVTFLADAAKGEVEAENADHQRRRAVASFDATKDLVLDVAVTPSEGLFHVSVWAGAGGFDPAAGQPIIDGQVLVADGKVVSYDLDILLVPLTVAFPQVDAAGTMRVTLQSFADGRREVWYDFAGVSFSGSVPEDRLTTYWVFADNSKALEFFRWLDDREAVAYARWGQAGGRYDDHVSYQDAIHGDVDDLSTGCWDTAGAETFYGYALIDVDFTFWGERRGSETTGCAFRPVADHPYPELRPQFKWFTTFHWDTLVLMPL